MPVAVPAGEQNLGTKLSRVELWRDRGFGLEFEDTAGTIVWGHKNRDAGVGGTLTTESLDGPATPEQLADSATGGSAVGETLWRGRGKQAILALEAILGGSLISCGPDHFRDPLMKRTGRTHGEPRVFLWFKKWQKNCIQTGFLPATPSSLPATLFRGLSPKPLPFSFTSYAPADTQSVLFPFTKEGFEVCKGPGLSSLTDPGAQELKILALVTWQAPVAWGNAWGKLLFQELPDLLTPGG